MIGSSQCNNYDSINRGQSEEAGKEPSRAEFQLIASSRGGNLLALNGFLFRLNYKRKDRTYWKCKTSGCLSTAIISDAQGLVSCRENHNHSDDQSELQLRSNLNEMKRNSCQRFDHAACTATNSAIKPVTNDDKTQLAEVPTFDGSFYLSGIEFDSTNLNYFKTELPEEEIAAEAIKFEQVCMHYYLNKYI